MGKITDALKKAAEDRVERIEKINKIKANDVFIVKEMENSKVDPRLVAYFDPKAVITEQYKSLRTNILSLNKNKPPKVIVITSSIHSEGKTITSLNLAVSLAQSTQKPKVLLIDADMRRGRVIKYLGVDQEIGLSDVLLGNSGAEEALFNIDIKNLTFMGAGIVPDNPSELLGSQALRRFLTMMKAQFDHIIIDTPPVVNVTDSSIIASQADGVVLVIQAGRTQRGIIKRAQELLNQSHAKILGHVLTNIQYHLPEYIYRYL